jgi:hypothetical protein
LTERAPATSPVLSTDQLKALDSALGEFLKEQGRTPMVSEPEGGDGLSSFTRLDQALSGALEKSGHRPMVDPADDPGEGLLSLLTLLTTGPHAPSPAGPSPSPGESPVEPPARSPEPGAPPAKPPGPTVATEPAGAGEVVSYKLARVVFSRDGGVDEESSPTPGARQVVEVKISHRGGTPPAELALDVALPDLLVLGRSTQIKAQAVVTGSDGAGELVLLGEVVDGPRGGHGGARVGASGQVTFSFVRRVGGIYAYQQVFDGALITPREPHSVLLNWTDRESSIEFPFSWATQSPTVRVQGRAIYLPNRPKQ